MPHTLPADLVAPRRRPGGPRRWTAADPARHLAAFAARGGTILAYCAAAGVPRATFTQWQRERRRAAPVARAARRPRSTRPTFARVQVVAPPIGRAITLVVRSAVGLEAEVSGLDAATVVVVVRGMLRPSAP